MQNMNNSELLDKILENQTNGKVSIMTIEGLMIADINKFCKQGIEGILYDLNRDKASLMTLARDSKNVRWVNDLASAYVIEYLLKELENESCEKYSLQEKVNKLEKELNKYQEKISTEVNVNKTYEPINAYVNNSLTEYDDMANLTKKINTTNSRIGIEHNNNIIFTI